MVQVLETAPAKATQTATTNIGGLTIHWDIIGPIIILAVIIGIVAGIFIYILSKIIKKIKNKKRAKEDLEFRKYQLDLKNCFLNKNPKYKKRNPLTFFLTWKKAKVYFRTSNGKKLAGYYDGELVKKEGYFILALEMRYSFFKRETDLIIIPYKLKDKIIFFNDDGTIDIEAEGIDETLASEYFSIPVLKNEFYKNKKEVFIDFSNEIIENYLKKYAYRDVIKTNIIDFARNIHEATEMNTTIPYKRKTNNDLNN